MLLSRKPDVAKLEAKRDIKGLGKALDYNPEKDWTVGARAAQAFGKIGDPAAIPPLIRALASENHKVRVQAVKALHEIRDAPRPEPLDATACDAIREALIRALGDTSSLRAPAAAATALGAAGDARAVEALIRALRGRGTDVRLAAVKALGVIGDGRVVEALIDAATHDRDSNVRTEAVDALFEIGDGRVVEALSDIAVADDAEQVRKTASDAVCALGDALTISALRDRAEVAQYDREVNQAIRALAGENPLVRREGAETLKRLGDARAVKALTGALHDEDRNVRKTAVEALQATGNTRKLTDLRNSEIRTLRNWAKDTRAREQAADLLGWLGDTRAVSALIDAALHDDDPQMRKAATEAAQTAGGTPMLIAAREREAREAQAQREREVSAAIHALGDGDSQVRRHGAETIGELGVERAPDALIKAALHDEDLYVRVAAAAALRAIDDPRAVPVLIKALQATDGNPRKRTALQGTHGNPHDRAAAILQASRDPRAISALKKALAADAGLRRAMIQPCHDGQHTPDARCVCMKCGEAAHDRGPHCVCRRCGVKDHNFSEGVVGGYHHRCLGCGALMHVHTGDIMELD